MPNEISQSQKDKYMVPLICGTLNSQIHRDREQNRGYQGLWGGEDGELYLMGRELFQ